MRVLGMILSLIFVGYALIAVAGGIYVAIALQFPRKIQLVFFGFLGAAALGCLAMAWLAWPKHIAIGSRRPFQK